jgi:uridylate kinase
MASHNAPARVLLKLSGSAFAAGAGAFDETALNYIARELADAHQTCPQTAVMVGGGNVIRGARFCPGGSGRIAADYAGMLATVINALVLRDRLERLGVPTTHYGAFAVPRMVPLFEPSRAAADLADGRLVLLAGGTGNPLLTTDTAAAIRAVEVGAALVLKATRVNGVYTEDPERNPGAALYEQLSYRQVIEQRLGVMDLTAVSFCMEHELPVRVFNYAVAGNIRRAAGGERIGTLIGSSEDAR